MTQPNSSVEVNPLDVIKFLGEQVAELSKQLAVARARAEQAERRLAAVSPNDV